MPSFTVDLEFIATLSLYPRKCPQQRRLSAWSEKRICGGPGRQPAAIAPRICRLGARRMRRSTTLNLFRCRWRHTAPVVHECNGLEDLVEPGRSRTLRNAQGQLILQRKSLPPMHRRFVTWRHRARGPEEVCACVRVRAFDGQGGPEATRRTNRATSLDVSGAGPRGARPPWPRASRPPRASAPRPTGDGGHRTPRRGVSSPPRSDPWGHRIRRRGGILSTLR